MKTYDELKSLIDRRGVHAVFGEPGEGYFIEQNAAELAEFLVAMQALGVSSVLEIGTGYKAGLARFLHDHMGWEVVSVDVRDYGHEFSGITFLTLNEAENMPMFGQPDLLLLDGDHSYEGVKHDHEEYGHIAAKVIAFHDIAGLRDCMGVREYWEEISFDPNYLKPGYHEIAAKGEQRGGIGYIVLAEVEAPDLSAQAQIAGDAASPVYSTGNVHIDEIAGIAGGKPPANHPAPRKLAAKRTPAKKAVVKK